MRFLSWLIIASILLRGLIPSGYMPSAAETGQFFKVVICTGYGTQNITLDENGKPVKQDTEKHHTQKIPCLFALNTQGLTPTDHTPQLQMPVVYTALVSTPPATHPATATLRKTAPPRAPPLFS